MMISLKLSLNRIKYIIADTFIAWSLLLLKCVWLPGCICWKYNIKTTGSHIVCKLHMHNVPFLDITKSKKQTNMSSCVILYIILQSTNFAFEKMLSFYKLLEIWKIHVYYTCTCITILLIQLKRLLEVFMGPCRRCWCDLWPLSEEKQKQFLQ